ncbi:unnamed protein product [Moneuplotes crassus]|uniref:Uncharacterized protein n=1 Tax=Euplotes crassus TaxID=5936 RepID=A0AAD1UF27_EUPCR|nr:unnamed protein product [Moneuplotes crassus]
MSFSDSSQDYSQYVQSKVYQPIMSSLNDDGLARRVEKLERDNAILDRYIQDLYKKMSNSTGTQSENHTPSKAMAELEFRLDKIEKLLSLQAIGRKFGKENQDINQDYFNRCQRISSDYAQQQVRHEDLDRLETKLVKLMKTQAEDIAVDVTDLEKYTQRVDSKLRNFCLEDHVTRKEFHQLEKILDKKIEISTNLMEGVLSEAREIISKAATLKTRFPEKSENMSPSGRATNSEYYSQDKVEHGSP